MMRAVAALASRRRTRAPGAEQRQRRRRRVGGHQRAKTPGAAGEGGIGKIVLDPPLFVEPPVREDDDRLPVRRRRARLLDQDRAEEPAADLPCGGGTGVGKIEVEAGVGRREANVEIGPGRDEGLRQAADPRYGVRRPQAGKAQRRAHFETVGEPQRQLFAPAQAQQRPGRAAIIAEKPRRGGRRRRDLAGGGRGLEAARPVGRRRRLRTHAAPPSPKARRDAAAQERAPVHGHGRLPGENRSISAQRRRRRICGRGGRSRPMGKFITFLGLILGLALIAIATASWRFIEDGAGGATALALAGGIFTIALAASIRD